MTKAHVFSHLFPRAAIASPHYLATIAGLDVLQRGGNAVDAAIATNLVLAVVSPHLCGVGGDLFAMVHAEGNVYGLNSSGRLPTGARLPGDGAVPVRGVGAATVPGAVAGWLALADRFGSWPIEKLAEPAIRYAAEGFPVSPGLANSIERSRPMLSDDPEFVRIFLDAPLGKRTNEDLARTLSSLGDFYTGAPAKNAPAPFTADDFAAHRAEWVDPMRASYAGCEIFEMPPNSRGHLVLKALELCEPLTGLSAEEPEFHLRMMRALDAATLSGDTVYLCAWDESGMTVSMNESNYMGFGSGAMIPGTGVHLHNRGAYLTPQTYEPGARPIHTLAPAMAMRDGKPHMLFGTMGGEAQIQIHMQLIARILVMGQDPGEAVGAPRWIKHSPDAWLAEEGLPDIGAEVIERSDIAGHAHVILRTDDGLAAASDPRSDGAALGY